MPSTKDIRAKISGIKKTQKITRAMQMVAASKMKKAQQRMEISIPYASKIREVMGHIVASHSEYKHRYLQMRDEVKNVGYIVIATDRGLCGGLNINSFRTLLREMQALKAKNIATSLCLFGSKAVNYFRHIGVEILARSQGFGDQPQVADLIGGIKIMIDAYDQGKLDRIFIAHNTFINKMVQKVNVIQLLPVTFVEAPNKAKYWDYIYEPDAKNLLNTIVVRYLETTVYQSVAENFACEQAARMLAMKNATDSAEELVEHLNIVYNKIRQATITQEISEIIGGAESL